MRTCLFRMAAIVVVSLGLAGASIVCAAAAEAKSSCVSLVPADRKLVRAMAGQFQAISVKGLPPILIAHLPYLQADDRVAHGLAGTVVFFRKSPGRWSAFFPADRETEAYSFVAPAVGAFVMLTEWSVEGPMPHWSAVRVTRRFSRFECVTVEYPKHLSDYRVISSEKFASHIESFRGHTRPHADCRALQRRRRARWPLCLRIAQARVSLRKSRTLAPGQALSEESLFNGPIRFESRNRTPGSRPQSIDRNEVKSATVKIARLVCGQ